MRYNTRKTQHLVPTILTTAETLAELESIAQSANTVLIRASIYKGESRQQGRSINLVSRALSEIYYDKCAYCENEEHKPEVEHYRPKKGVASLASHSGYYWLCYEWTNLLPSCRYCNTEGGKGNKFPIMGIRVERPEFFEGRLDQAKCMAANAPLLQERPYLLHPEIDDPKLYFRFYDNGRIEGIDRDGRGASTIEICNLNRDNLLSARQKIIDHTIEAINFALFSYIENQLEIHQLKPLFFWIFDKMKEKQQPNKPFSLMAEYVFEYFIDIVVPLLDESIRAVITEAHNSYLQTNHNP